MRWIVRALAAAFVLAAGLGNAQAPGAKLALVVGVSDYGRERAAQEAAGFVVPPPLANAVRDAELVASALESKGFTVTRVTNPDKRALLSSVNAFAAALGRAGPDAVGLFYFAGHGAQGRPALERDIDNYLIPLGADLATEVDLESEALALSRISAALRPAPQGAMVLILDACRDFALPAASRSGLVTRGLAEARAAPGTIIAYATSPGATALDNLPGQSNGPYATALAAEIRAAQGARLEDVFIGTRNKVLAATRNTQTPWENGSLRRAVTLGVAPTSTSIAVDRARQPPPPLPTTRPGETFKECDVCPEMIVVPAGSFNMGVRDDVYPHETNEAPQRRVTLLRPFAVGKFEVTFDEWDSCVRNGGCRAEGEEPHAPADAGWGRGRRPVIHVSWEDARRYVAWLNIQVGGSAYRLLTEPEWEYAAKGGSSSSYFWGSNPNEACQYGNIADLSQKRSSPSRDTASCDDGVAHGTAEVGRYKPNSFGLYDMIGNVSELIEDCLSNNYAGHATDGRSYQRPQGYPCSSRVIRGGSFEHQPYHIRSTRRASAAPSDRYDWLGFRVARTLQ